MARKAALKHDAQGFLVGDPIDLGKLTAVWSAIREDIRAIRQAVLGTKSAAHYEKPEARPSMVMPRKRESHAGKAAPALSKTGGADGNAFRRQQTEADAVAHAVDRLRTALPAIVRAPVEPVRRDVRGRFVKGETSNPPQSKKKTDSVTQKNQDKDDAGHDESLLRSVGERVASAVKETGSGLEEADPAVKAVAEVAQPMMRGYELLSGGNREKRKERWFRRIWQTLTGTRKEQGIFNKIAAKRLKAIEEKPVAEASGGGGFLGGMLALLAGLFAKIPGLKKLLPAAAVGAAGVGAAAAAARAGKGSQTGKKPGRMARLLRRVPILGALMGGAGLAADLYAAETDATLTRTQKDRRAGQGVGGLAGGVGGMVGGAKLGAMAGAVGGPIGAAIGGFVGGALGLFLGDQAGQIIGDKVGLWASYLREADIPGKITSAWNGAVDIVKSGWSEIKAAALGTWDWMKSGWDSAIDTMKSGWESLKEGMKSAFDSTLDTLDKGWKATKKAAGSTKDWVVEKGSAAAEWVAEKGNAANDAIFNATGVDVKAGVGRVADGAANLASTAKDGIVSAGQAIADGAVRVKDAMVNFGSRAADKVSDTAGRTWSGAKNLLAKAVPQSLRNKIAVHRAMETATDYRQGNIAGLDDTHTRALVASTAETESSGGKLDVVNSAGYMGRYQAGAAWLADAGLLKGGSASVQAAMKADGFTNEWKWAQSGGMTRFLKNAGNWKEGLSYEQYLASANIQDAAFKTNSDKTYRWLVNENLINDATPQAEIAGLLKARHISGHGGAKQVARGGTGPVDANGTSARKYYDDLASGSVYLEAFASDATPVTTTAAVDARAPAAPVASITTAPAVPEISTAAPPPQTAASIQPHVAPVSVSVPAPKVPSVPAVASAADAPAVAVPLSGNDASRPVSVVTVPADVGQDVRERGIAHIVTGGLAR